MNQVKTINIHTLSLMFVHVIIVNNPYIFLRPIITQHGSSMVLWHSEGTIGGGVDVQRRGKVGNG